MSLGSKIKTGLGTVVAVGVVIAVGGFFLHDTRKTPGPGEDMYTFHAIFKPERREQKLTITIDLNGVRFRNRQTFTSPWDEAIILPKGSQVKLEVWQREGGALDCIIFRNTNGVVQSFPNKIEGPGGCVTTTG